MKCLNQAHDNVTGCDFVQVGRVQGNRPTPSSVPGNPSRRFRVNFQNFMGTVGTEAALTRDSGTPGPAQIGKHDKEEYQDPRGQRGNTPISFTSQAAPSSALSGIACLYVSVSCDSRPGCHLQMTGECVGGDSRKQRQTRCPGLKQILPDCFPPQPHLKM